MWNKIHATFYLKNVMHGTFQDFKCGTKFMQPFILKMLCMALFKILNKVWIKICMEA